MIHPPTANSERSPDVPNTSRVRYQVLAFTVALGGVTYLDRVCIAQTAQVMMDDLRLSNQQMGFVFGAFILAYAVFEMPSGSWGDRIGPRLLLTRIVTWWSCFTIATAGAFNYASLLAVRFLFGMGEAGAFPNVSKTFSRWFPRTERGTAQGIFFAGAHLGGGLTPLLVTAMLGVMSWRMVFVVFGATGFIWAVAWFHWFRDEPSSHPEVSADELRYIEAGRGVEVRHGPGRGMFWHVVTHKNIILLCLMYFTQAYGFYFFITWLPTYLVKARGFTSTQLGLLAGLPLILGAGADLAGGLATDRAVRAWGLRRPVRDRLCLALAGGWCDDRRRGGGRPFAVGSAALAGRRGGQLPAGRGVGHVPGYRWRACRSGDGRHEHRRSDRCVPEPDHLALPAGGRAPAGGLGPAPVPCRSMFLAGAFCWLLVDPNRSVLEPMEQPA